MKEVLVILRRGVVPAQGWAAPHVISSSLPPRVWVLRGDIDAAKLQAQPGVEVVLMGASSIPGSLSAAEELFVRGWVAQADLAKKQRIGEGLSWDAPGFRPPGDDRDGKRRRDDDN